MLSAAERHGSSRGSWKTSPIRGSGAGDRVAVERTAPRVRREQPGDDAQERRLAAAVRPDERDDLAARDVEVEPVEDRQPAAVAASGRRSRRRRRGSRPVDGRGHACAPRGSGRQRRIQRRVYAAIGPVVRRAVLGPRLEPRGRCGSSTRIAGGDVRAAPRSRPRRGSPSRGRPSRARPGRATGKPVTSALIWFQVSLRAGPPQTRIAVTVDAGREHRRRRRGGSRARSPRRSPARGGRDRGPGSGPTNAPVASGSQIGERSPARYGRKTRPSAPGGVVAASSSSRSVRDATADDVVAEPVERPAGRRHRRADAVQPVERRRRDERAGHLDRLVPVDAEAARRAARVVGVARLGQARAEVAREGVVRAARDRDAGTQAERLGRRRRSARPTIAPIARRAGRRSVARPVAAATTRRIRDGLAGHERRDGDAGQPERQPLPGREVPARPRGDVRLVALQPQRGRQRAERPAPDAGRGGQLVGLGGRPRVEEGDRRAGRLAALVDRDERRAVAVDADRRRRRPAPAAGARGPRRRPRTTRRPGPAPPSPARRRRRARSRPAPSPAGGRRGRPGRP